MSRGETRPAVASNGSGFLVAWVDGGAPGSTVYFARYDASGTLLDPHPVKTGLTGGAAVFWDGAKHPLTTGGQNQRVDAATGALDAPFAPSPLPLLPAGVGFGGGLILASWDETLSLSQADATLFSAADGSNAQAVSLPPVIAGRRLRCGRCDP